MGGGGGVKVAFFGEVFGSATGEGVVALHPMFAGRASDLVVACR